MNGSEAIKRTKKKNQFLSNTGIIGKTKYLNIYLLFYCLYFFFFFLNGKFTSNVKSK